ncbi:hypothetical protein EJ08DRAFT_681599 [Tothia fuscella]|uniref:Rhodopsin domain-containing protein n=1 Tax=Tothia fuscella TaxID=1048955 RepID=A0A9P4NKH7_9PEZI|nr:hypothetical protein EJ08DRAFT_681599 [Tothia fuscella]
MVESRGSEILGVIILFLTLSWITFLARCWVRIRMIQAFAIDDWLLLFTLWMFTVYSGFVFVGVYWGAGKHMHDLSTREIINAMRAWYWGEITYIITTTVLRLAVGTFLLRIAVRKAHRKVVYTCIVVNVLYNLYWLIFTIVQCSPVSGFWLRFGGMENVNCHTDIAVASTFAASGLSALVDWVFGLLPVFMLWDLKMNARKKIAVGMIMGVGAIASTAPIIRIPYTKFLSTSHDFLWLTTDVSIWSCVEPGLGISAISLASLRPLFVSLFKGASSTSGSRDRRYASYRRSAYIPPRPPTPRHVPSSSTTSTPGKPPSPPSRKERWGDNNDFELPLQGLSPPMGHSVHVEGGSPTIERKPAKLTKSNGNSPLSRSGKSFEECPSPNPRQGLGITRTYEYRQWSTDELNTVPAPAPFGPLEKVGHIVRS